MRRVLLISYYFPPQPQAGALRPSFLRRFLPHYGWRVEIATRSFPGLEPSEHILDVPNRLLVRERSAPAASSNGTLPLASASAYGELRKLASTLYWRTLAGMYPDPALLWAIETALTVIARRPRGYYDAIVSTALPASVHLAGALLAHFYRVPWIADFRDPWSGYPYRNASALRKWMDAALEPRLLRRASAIVTVNDELVAHLGAIHRSHRVVSIPNGVDPALLEGADPEPPHDFTLLYSGMLYDGQLSPAPLFEAVARLRAAGDPAGAAARFAFYGPDRDVVENAATRAGIRDAVEIHGTVSREVVLAAQRKAAVLLLLLKDDPHMRAALPSKTWEYVGARRPVLGVLPSDSAAARFLRESGIGTSVADTDACSEAIRVLYQRYARGEHVVTSKKDWTPWTAHDVAREFAALLDHHCGPASLAWETAEG